MYQTKQSLHNISLKSIKESFCNNLLYYVISNCGVMYQIFISFKTTIKLIKTSIKSNRFLIYYKYNNVTLKQNRVYNKI